MICPICQKEGKKSILTFLGPVDHLSIHAVYYPIKWDENGLPIHPFPDPSRKNRFSCSNDHLFTQ